MHLGQQIRPRTCQTCIMSAARLTMPNVEGARLSVAAYARVAVGLHTVGKQRGRRWHTCEVLHMGPTRAPSIAFFS